MKLHEHELRRQFPHWWWVRLLKEDIDWITSIGVQRNSEGKRQGKLNHSKDDSDQWNIAGVAGEWAASMVYNLPMSCPFTTNYKKLGNLSDVGELIECKTRMGSDSARWDLAVNDYQLDEKKIYLGCLSGFWPEYVVVMGWERGSAFRSPTATKQTVKYPRSREIFFYPWQQLKDPMSLFDVIRVAY